jgi:hypothetical protein
MHTLIHGHFRIAAQRNARQQKSESALQTVTACLKRYEQFFTGGTSSSSSSSVAAMKLS